MPVIKRHISSAVLWAIIIHVIAILLLVVGYQVKRDFGTEKKIDTVQATVIQQKDPVVEQKQTEAEKFKQREIEKQAALEKEKQHLEQELALKRKEAEEAKARAEEAKKQADLEQKRAEDAKKQAELEQKLAAEKKKQEEAKRIAEEKKKAEEKRLTEEKRKKEEAKRVAEEKKKQEQKRLADERAAEEELLAKSMAAEESELAAVESQAQQAAQSRELQGLLAEYQAAIRSRIQSRWRKPMNEQLDATCEVYVRQAPGGIVEEVVVERCTGDESFRRSVEEAVWKADPLPQPPKPEIFDRELRFKFRPQG